MDREKILQNAVPLLLKWYQKHRRMLPWRADPTPYRVWLSETMLQQTRIEAAIPYYERFIAEIPSIEALAAADSDRLMKLWEGLGYYSRVRNLKKAAEELVASYDGKLPDNKKGLLSLPGIGEYTAGAIASIAFGQPEPAVDGNVLRVCARLLLWEEDVLQSKSRKAVSDLLAAVYPHGGDASLLTEGIMELGETVCVPNGRPKCESCPLRTICGACRGSLTDVYPRRAPKKARKTEQRTVFLLVCHAKYAIRRREEGLLKGMWELPGTEGDLTPMQAEQFLGDRGLTVVSCRSCGQAKHIFTHAEWHMHGYLAECAAESPAFLWRAAEEIRTEYAVPSAFRFFLKKMGGPSAPDGGDNS